MLRCEMQGYDATQATTYVPQSSYPTPEELHANLLVIDSKHTRRTTSAKPT